MPDSNSFGGLVGTFPLASYTASFQINSGTAIAAGNTAAAQTITFTGLALTDDDAPSNYAIAPRNTITIPAGLVMISSFISATDTLTVQWKNVSDKSITPPASATWTCVVYREFFR